MTIPPIHEHEIDEALWTAYRRHDKSAVTDQLLRHYLPALILTSNSNASIRVPNEFNGNKPGQFCRGTRVGGVVNAARDLNELIEEIAHADALVWSISRPISRSSVIHRAR
jgi:hypothetical protein